MDSDAPIMISALQHHSYCSRQCALIHMEQIFVDNVHTLRGTHEHERVDQSQHDTVAGVRVEFALPIWSHRLGLTGRCDVVEFHPGGQVIPVEYKHGKRKKWINDDLQLAAQAICLEEMLQVQVPLGAIYHQQSRRRREVNIDDKLRGQVEETVCAVRAVLSGGQLPPPTTEEQRCPECSLLEICLPDLARAHAKIQQLRDSLFSPQETAL